MDTVKDTNVCAEVQYKHFVQSHEDQPSPVQLKDLLLGATGIVSIIGVLVWRLLDQRRKGTEER